MAIRLKSQLPEEVRLFLLDPKVFQVAEKLAETHQLPEAAVERIVDIAEEMTLGWHSLEKLPVIVVDYLKVEEKVAQAIAIEIAGQRLLPLSRIIGDVEGQLKSWGADLSQFTEVKELEMEIFNPENVVKNSLKEMGLTFPEQQLQHRLEYIMISFFTGERDREATKKILSRDSSLGGLELDEATSEKLLKTFSEKMPPKAKEEKPVPVETKPPAKDEPTAKELHGPGAVAAAAALADPVSVKTTTKPVAKKSQTKTVEKPAVKKIPEKQVDISLPEISEPKPPATAPSTESDPLVAAAIVAANNHAKKQKKIQATSAKTQPSKKPPKKKTRKVTERKVPDKQVTLNIGSNDLEKAEEEEIEKAKVSMKKNGIADQPLVNIKDAVDRVVKKTTLSFTHHDMKNRFASIVESRMRNVRDAFGTRGQLEREVDKGGLGVVGAPLVDVVQLIEQVYDEFQKTPYAKSLKSKKQTKKKDVDEKTVSTQGDPLAQRYQEMALRASSRSKKETKKSKTVTPRYSKGSVHAKKSGRPKVQDVKFVRRLAGPIDELRNMTLDDFRRLSSDPKEATIKIKDKVDLLEEEGDEKKIQAIKAWRQSPINQLYMSLTRESLMGGKSVVDIVNEKRAAKQDTLTQEELTEIISLNSQLRF